MTKKDYKLFAELLRKNRKNTKQNKHIILDNEPVITIKELIDLFKSENPLFDKIRFENAVYQDDNDLQ